jgi:hypothetical protein
MCKGLHRFFYAVGLAANCKGFYQGFSVPQVGLLIDTGRQNISHQFQMFIPGLVVFNKGFVDQGRGRARIETTRQSHNTSGGANRQY